MKKFLGFLLIVLLMSCGASAQQYLSHTVKRGETIESIADKYNISKKDILRLNPDAKRGIRKNTILVIPSTDSVLEEDEKDITFKSHKVRKKETLYSISKKYDVTIDDILKFNPQVAKRGLKKGKRINIPQFKEKVVETVVTEETPEKIEPEVTTTSYTVKSKETKWGIAHSYGITIEELEVLNPEIKDGLKVGQEIKLPILKNESIPEIPTIDDYVFYTVKPKQTMYSLTRKFGLSANALQRLNPDLKDGLKAGMILKLPKEDSADLNVVDAVVTDAFSLAENIDAENVPEVVFMLPFKLNKINIDSVYQTKEILRDDNLLGYATDFYTGALMALDSIKKIGVSANIKVLDTEASTTKTKQLLSLNEIAEANAVIGPFLPDNIEIAAAALRSDGVPVISPLTSKEIKYNNVYQTIPSKKLLREKMLAFMKANKEGKNVIVIADNNHLEIKSKLNSIFDNATLIAPKKGNYITIDDIRPAIKPDIENWVILESDDMSLVANATSVLNSLSAEELDITLLTTLKNKKYESSNISNNHLANLKFHYPTVDKPSLLNNSFSKNYERKFKISPSRVAARGFDITYDILLRLAYDTNLSKSINVSGATEYVENKFDYKKKFMGGYYNEGVFIVKYDGLTIKEVKNDI